MDAGAAFLMISDRATSADRAAVPALLALGEAACCAILATCASAACLLRALRGLPQHHTVWATLWSEVPRLPARRCCARRPGWLQEALPCGPGHREC